MTGSALLLVLLYSISFAKMDLLIVGLATAPNIYSVGTSAELVSLHAPELKHNFSLFWTEEVRSQC